jgi:hypothetical protein
VLRDRRGTIKSEIPDIDLKSETLGSDPLAIYKPTGAKTIDAAKAMGNFTGWTFAAVNAIASEVANIQLRLYQIKGDDHEEQDDHPLLSALADLSGRWIDNIHGRRPPRGVVLDMDSSVSPTHGEEEMSVWNGHYACTCYHPLFLFNQFGDLVWNAVRCVPGTSIAPMVGRAS